MAQTIFLSYATGTFQPARDALCNSALSVGFDAAYARDDAHLNLDFKARNHEILSGKRGAGYWIWKPQIILQELKKAAAGDVLVYCDAGRSEYYKFTRMPNALIEKAKRSGFLTGVAIPQHGPLSKWTKRDAFLRLDMDSSEWHSADVIQATWSLWTPTPEAFAFLEAWIEACEDPKCVTDRPNTEGLENLPDFKDHRHDQSLSSLLTLKYNAPFLDYSNTSVFRLLELRRQAKLSHYFLKRIEDAESLETGWVIPALWKSFWALKR